MLPSEKMRTSLSWCSRLLGCISLTSQRCWVGVSDLSIESNLTPLIGVTPQYITYCRYCKSLQRGYLLWFTCFQLLVLHFAIAIAWIRSKNKNLQHTCIHSHTYIYVDSMRSVSYWFQNGRKSRSTERRYALCRVPWFVSLAVFSPRPECSENLPKAQPHLMPKAVHRNDTGFRK